MRKTKFLLLFISFIFFIASNINSQSIYSDILSDRIANYNIDVELDTYSKILNGSLVLEWKNKSTDTISELQFHMYLNAFKNSKSTFMKGSDVFINVFSFVDVENMWGWIDIISMEIVGGENLTSKITYIQPDDNNLEDQTVISVKLQNSIKPESVTKIKIGFIAKLPQIISRTGYIDDYFFVGQWFPKIGVLEPKGQRNVAETQWNCHQYHAQSEFYSDFGVYKVNITVPQDYKIGATGILYQKKENEDGTITHCFVAEDVIDFAWAASPKFVEYEKVTSSGKIIKALMQPEHSDLAYRHINAAIVALNYYKNILGEYPYPNLTIIDPPFKGYKSGGMEYPTLISTFSFSYTPFFVKIPELTTIHEFGHNYFMGIIASNEAEEPWLDEGFTSYFEAKIMEKNYPVFSFLGYNFEDFDIHRAAYTLYFNPQITEIDNNSWEFPLGSYSVMNYNKAALVLKTLENLVGEQDMNLILKKYYERWKFKHPTTTDFIDIVNEVVKYSENFELGKNMNWFFQQTIYNSGICDYKLASITNTLVEETNSGIFDESGVKVSIISDNKDYQYNSNVSVYRLGDIIIPVEVLVHFENGEEIIEFWNGEESIKNFSYTSKNKVLWAKVDYLDKIVLDINRNNNSYTIDEKEVAYYKYSIKFMFWLQNLIQTIGFLV